MLLRTAILCKAFHKIISILKWKFSIMHPWGLSSIKISIELFSSFRIQDMLIPYNFIWPLQNLENNQNLKLSSSQGIGRKSDFWQTERFPVKYRRKKNSLLIQKWLPSTQISKNKGEEIEIEMMLFKLKGFITKAQMKQYFFK